MAANQMQSSVKNTMNSVSTTSRIVRGLGTNALSMAISAASPVLLVPLFLHAWGPELYGRWLALTALVTYLSLVDLGGQNFFGNLLASAFARGDAAEFRDRFSEGVSLFLLIAVIAFAGLMFIILMPGIRFSHQHIVIGREDRLVLLFAGATFLSGVPFGIVSAAYRAAGLFVRGQMIGNLSRGFNFILFVAILLLRAQPWVYAGVWFAASLLPTIYQIFDIRRCVPAVRGTRISWEAARAGFIHLPGSLYFWLLALSNALNQQGVLIVLAFTGSAAGIALFATHRTICGLVGYIGAMVQAPMMPELTFLFSRNQQASLISASQISLKLVSLTSATASIGLWFILPMIYPLWTGKSLILNPTLLAVLLIQAVLAAGWSTSGWALLASNQHRNLACWAFVNGLLTIALSALFAPRYGVIGVAVASLIGDIACGLAVYPILASRLLGIPKLRMYETILLPVAALLPLLVMALSSAQVEIDSTLRTIGGAMTSILLMVLAALWAFREKDERDRIIGQLRSMAQ
jgi:O-antigen/teichoic acid export membrane protein